MDQMNGLNVASVMYRSMPGSLCVAWRCVAWRSEVSYNADNKSEFCSSVGNRYSILF
jgi:hypothetical protein